MRYRLQHARSLFPEITVSYGAHLPRVGDLIELDEVDYLVTVVWHRVKLEGPGREGVANFDPIVRVQ